MGKDGKEVSYKPSAYYWRRAIRTTDDVAQLRVIARALVDELELHKAFIRELGLIPPKNKIHPDELSAKPTLNASAPRASGT